MQKEYYVVVGDRVFGVYDNVKRAEEVAQAASGLYSADCYVSHKNKNRVKSVPVYRQGQKVQ